MSAEHNRSSSIWLNNVTLSLADTLHPEGSAEALESSLAVVVAGGREVNSRNGVLGVSPSSTWRRLLSRKRTFRTVRFFLCTSAAQTAVALTWLAGNWSFPAVSQFHRLLLCLQHVEEHWPKRHAAFLRLRPDALVFGPLPRPLLPAGDGVLYGQVYLAKAPLLQQLMRDEVRCGSCERSCLCELRKYGGGQWQAAAAHCAVITDQTFLFARRLLPAIMHVLTNYSSAHYGHPARARSPQQGLFPCLPAGALVEIGWSRLLEQASIPVAPLRLRTLLDRELQPTTPPWISRKCVSTWDERQAMPCAASCVPDSYLRRQGGGNATRFIAGHSIEPVDSQGRRRRDAHCNQIWVPVKPKVMKLPDFRGAGK